MSTAVAAAVALMALAAAPGSAPASESIATTSRGRAAVKWPDFAPQVQQLRNRVRPATAAPVVRRNPFALEVRPVRSPQNGRLTRARPPMGTTAAQTVAPTAFTASLIGTAETRGTTGGLVRTGVVVNGSGELLFVSIGSIVDSVFEVVAVDESSMTVEGPDGHRTTVRLWPEQ